MAKLIIGLVLCLFVVSCNMPHSRNPPSNTCTESEYSDGEYCRVIGSGNITAQAYSSESEAEPKEETCEDIDDAINNEWRDFMELLAVGLGEYANSTGAKNGYTLEDFERNKDRKIASRENCLLRKNDQIRLNIERQRWELERIERLEELRLKRLEMCHKGIVEACSKKKTPGLTSEQK